MASLGPLVLKLQADAGPLGRDLAAAQSKIAQASSAMANVPAPKLPFSGAIQAAQDRLGGLNSAISKAFANVPGGQAISGALTGVTSAASGALSTIGSLGNMLMANPWAAAAVGIAAVAAGLGYLAYSGFSTITALKDMMETFGLTAEAAVGLSFAFTRIGADQNRAEASLRKFEIKLGELAQNPSGELGNQLRSLGVDVDRLLQLPLDQQLGVVADRFAGMSNAAERAHFAQSIFGKDWVGLRELLSQGSAGLEAAAAASRVLGISMNGIDVETVDHAAKTAMRAWANVGTLFTSTAQRVAVAFAPAVEAVGGFVERLIILIQPVFGIVRDLLAGAAAFIGGIISVAVGSLDLLSPVFSGIFQVVGALWNALKAGASVIGDLVGGAFAGLVTVLDVIWSVLQVVIEVGLVPFRIAWELLQVAVSALMPAWDALGTVLGSIGLAFGAVLGAIRSVASFILDTLLSAVQGAIGAFGTLFGIAARIPGIGRAFTGLAASAEGAVARIQALRDGLAGTAQAGADMAAQTDTASNTQQQSSAVLADYDKLLERYAAANNFFGLQGRQLEIAQLATRGLNDSQIEALRLHDEQLTRLEREAKLRDRIARTVEQAATPLDQFNAHFSDLGEQLRGGLDINTWASAVLSDIDKLEKAAGLGEVKAPAALNENTAAAVSAINRAQLQNTQPTDPVERLLAAQNVLRQQAEVQTEYQRRLVEAFENGRLFDVVETF